MEVGQETEWEEIKSVCLQNESKGLLYLKWSLRGIERDKTMTR